MGASGYGGYLEPPVGGMSAGGFAEPQVYMIGGAWGGRVPPSGECSESQGDGKAYAVSAGRPEAHADAVNGDVSVPPRAGGDNETEHRPNRHGRNEEKHVFVGVARGYQRKPGGQTDSKTYGGSPAFPRTALPDIDPDNRVPRDNHGTAPILEHDDALLIHVTERVWARYWSGREDLNLRPPAPKAGALPGCATPRWSRARRGRAATTATMIAAGEVGVQKAWVAIRRRRSRSASIRGPWSQGSSCSCRPTRSGRPSCPSCPERRSPHRPSETGSSTRRAPELRGARSSFSTEGGARSRPRARPSTRSIAGSPS